MELSTTLEALSSLVLSTQLSSTVKSSNISHIKDKKDYKRKVQLVHNIFIKDVSSAKLQTNKFLRNSRSLDKGTGSDSEMLESKEVQIPCHNL